MEKKFVNEIYADKKQSNSFQSTVKQGALVIAENSV